VLKYCRYAPIFNKKKKNFDYQFGGALMKTSVHGITAAAVTLAAALSLTVIGPHRAYAAPHVTQGDSNLAVTVLSPTPRSTFGGAKPVEISAFYQGSYGNQVTTIDLLVDGVPAASKKLDAPEIRGVISFLVDASALSSGTHRIVIRATGADGEIVSAKSSFIFQAPAVEDQGTTSVAAPATDGSTAPPELSFINPSINGQVSGTIKIELNAQDSTGKNPYVSLFIDRAFKTLKNYPPYEFEWDTTGYSNGYHTIDAFGYDDEQNVGHAKSLRLFVNNPGGRTERRTDLKDAAPAVKSVLKTPAAMPARAKAAMPGAAMLASSGNSSTKIALPVMMAKLDDLSADTMDSALTPGLSNPFLSNQPTASMTMKKAIAPLKPTQAKSALPSATMMASVPVSTQRPSITQLASNSDLTSETSKLSMTPGLSNPFVSSAATHPSVAPAAIASQPSNTNNTAQPVLMAKSDLTTDTAHLQVAPGMSSPFITAKTATVARAQVKTAPSVTDGTLAVTDSVASTNVGQSTSLMQISDARLPANDLSSPYMIAPKLYTNLPGNNMVIVSASPLQSAHTVRVHTAGTGNLLRSKGQTSVLFNNTVLRLDRPIAEQGHIMFSPLRQIFEFQGGTLDWLPDSNSVHAVSSSKDILLTLGQKHMTVNKTAILLPSAPYLATGRTMVPFSFFSQAMDMDVQYDQSNGHVLITSKK
jgi:hypothetical protein